MAHFYGWLKGNRGTVTRVGSKSSGITATIRSWNNKVEVLLMDKNGEDHLILIIPDKLNKVVMNGNEIDLKLITKHRDKVAKIIKEVDIMEEL